MSIPASNCFSTHLSSTVGCHGNTNPGGREGELSGDERPLQQGRWSIWHLEIMFLNFQLAVALVNGK